VFRDNKFVSVTLRPGAESQTPLDTIWDVVKTGGPSILSTQGPLEWTVDTCHVQGTLALNRVQSTVALCWKCRGHGVQVTVFSCTVVTVFSRTVEITVHWYSTVHSLQQRSLRGHCVQCTAEVTVYSVQPRSLYTVYSRGHCVQCVLSTRPESPVSLVTRWTVLAGGHCSDRSRTGRFTARAAGQGITISR